MEARQYLWVELPVMPEELQIWSRSKLQGRLPLATPLWSDFLPQTGDQAVLSSKFQQTEEQWLPGCVVPWVTPFYKAVVGFSLTEHAEW